MTRLLRACLAAACLSPIVTHGAEQPAAGPSPSPGQSTVEEIVFVASGGTYYHRDSCPRLHFGRPIALKEAAGTYLPCPVCKPPALKPAPESSTTAEGRAARAPEPPEVIAPAAPIGASTRATPEAAPREQHGTAAAATPAAQARSAATPAAKAAAAPPQAGRPLAGYRTLVVEAFTVEKEAATGDFPDGQERVLHKNAVVGLLNQQIFDQVLEPAEIAGESAAPSAGSRLVVSGTVIAYDKGSRAARSLIGFGAGAAKVKVRFVFRDAQSGEERLRLERQSKFYGMRGWFGGSEKDAKADSTEDLVNGLIAAVRTNR